MQGRVAAPAGGAGPDVAAPPRPPLDVAAVVGDLEDASLVEVETATLAFQTLKKTILKFSGDLSTFSVFSCRLQSGIQIRNMFRTYAKKLLL